MTSATYSPGHLAALRRFALAITVLTVLGHAVLGFEPSYAQPLVAVATAYAMQLLLELVEARCNGRRPRFAGGPIHLVDFLLSAHISGLAVAMLLYFNDRLWVVAFAASVAIASKTLFRAPLGTGTRHVFNPSNFGIVATLLLFPGSVGLVQPWQFTEELPGHLDWALFAAICTLGTYLNGRFTRRLPLIAAWVGGFVLQASLRSVLFHTSLSASLAPMTGLAFVLFTFYMAPDPATTPAASARAGRLRCGHRRRVWPAHGLPRRICPVPLADPGLRGAGPGDVGGVAGSETRYPPSAPGPGDEPRVVSRR